MIKALHCGLSTLDDIPATGTGTLVIEIEDVNDSRPTIREKTITVCNQDPLPVVLSVIDEDGPGFSAPFHVELLGVTAYYLTARMNNASKLNL